MEDAVLIINAGSSSIKFAIYAGAADSTMGAVASGSVAGIGSRQARFEVRKSHAGHTVLNERQIDAAVDDHGSALEMILDWLERETSNMEIVGAGHRVVHGGTTFCRPVVIDEAVLARLKELIPLAPVHQPHALHAIEKLLRQRPAMPQVACFDTAFHANMPWKEQRFALPRELLQKGIRRYGFHGLSYEYVVSVLPDYLAEAANCKIVIAHLGYGVSMCAVNKGRSIATTMSFTPLDGLPMGTRCGNVDPAVVLYLLAHGMRDDEISELLHNRSGLLGLSGISGDMHVLLSSGEANAIEAVEFFCYHINRELGSLAAALGGVDAVVFTGGIGEHAPAVRAAVCRAAAWLGIELDARANNNNAICISAISSATSVWVIPTNEEKMIAHHTQTLLSSNPSSRRNSSGPIDRIPEGDER